MSLLRKLLLLVILLFTCWGCNYLNRRYEEHEQRWRGVIDTVNRAQNAQRIKLGIPVVPDSNWKVVQRIIGDSSGIVSLENNTPGIDSLPRYAQKQIYFEVPSFQPVLEIDSYYSGRRFIEGDPDYTGWERLALTYAYRNGNVPVINPSKTYKKGRTAIFYEAKPQFVTSNTNPAGGYMTIIMERPVSLVQADSVLKAWKLSTGGI